MRFHVGSSPIIPRNTVPSYYHLLDAMALSNSLAVEITFILRKATLFPGECSSLAYGALPRFLYAGLWLFRNLPTKLVPL